MDALSFRSGRSVALVAALVCFGNSAATAAGYQTANFTVDAPTPQLAKEIGDAAEYWRRELAKEWLGKTLPQWSRRCPIKARVSSQLGAGGATSFVFDKGEVFGWRMNIQGSRERILDSVLPHEVTHTLFASHFRQPLPRWADEGACTTVEHRSEIAKQERMLIEFLKTRRGIPFSTMFAMKEYPQDVLPLYAQGHSLARFLIAQRGKQEFLGFLGDGMGDEDWPRAVKENYGYSNLLALQNAWMDWVRNGRPEIAPAADSVLIASGDSRASRTDTAGVVVRGQDPGTVSPKAKADPSVASVYAASPREQADAGSWAPVTNPARVDLSDAPGRPASPVTWPPLEGEQVASVPARTGGSVYDASRNRGTVLR